MVKPKLISDSEVRITLIRVRSALMRVRWNDSPVRRLDNSMEVRSGLDSSTAGIAGTSATAPSLATKSSMVGESAIARLGQPEKNGTEDEEPDQPQHDFGQEDQRAVRLLLKT